MAGATEAQGGEQEAQGGAEAAEDSGCAEGVPMMHQSGAIPKVAVKDKGEKDTYL